VITVRGDHWPTSDTLTIGLADSGGTITRTSGIATNSDGSFSTSIGVPDGAAAGTAQIWLESRFTGGAATRMAAQPFTVDVAAPTVTAVQQGSGPEAGGTVVTITGADFAGATDVRFGGVPASQFKVDSNTQITATAPPGTGTVDVTVSTPAGTSATGPVAHRYSYIPAPAIASVSPASGPPAGGTSVTIRGTSFESGATVAFGPAAATNVIVVDPTQITATAPPGTGPVDITVTTANGTSSPGAADRFTYVSPLPSPLPPTVSPGTATPKTSQQAALTGTVNPQGASTVVHFEYGLDVQYRPPGTAGIVYDQATPDEPVGSGTAVVRVTAAVSGLVPNALYHVRLVATSAAGTTRGPDQTFSTPQDPAPPTPVLGQSENIKPAGGTVFVLSAGKLIPLTEARQLPSGSVLDTRRGTINLTAAAGAGKKLQTGTFTGAVFKLTQTRVNKGLTTLALVEGGFPGAPSYASCRAARAAATGHAALSGRILQSLRSRATGRFSTRGRYAAATVRGTQWTTTDRCDGTLIAVQLHRVLVTDFVKRLTVLVSAGHSYLARARSH
jgi:hypothetical protein